MSDREDFFFSESWSHNLETDREGERGIVGRCRIACGY
jgi:hypothetical protein